MHFDRAGLRRRDSEECAGNIGTSGADEAAKANDLALADLETDVLEDAGKRQFADLERDVADLGALLVQIFLERAADHQPDDVGIGEIADRFRRDLVAIAEDGDAVAQGAHLFKAMRNEDDRATFVAQAARNGKERVDFLRRQRRGRLVHDDDAAVGGQRAGDLDHLLVGDRKTAHRPRDVDRNAE